MQRAELERLAISIGQTRDFLVKTARQQRAVESAARVGRAPLETEDALVDRREPTLAAAPITRQVAHHPVEVRAELRSSRIEARQVEQQRREYVLHDVLGSLDRTGHRQTIAKDERRVLAVERRERL